MRTKYSQLNEEQLNALTDEELRKYFDQHIALLANIFPLLNADQKHEAIDMLDHFADRQLELAHSIAEAKRFSKIADTFRQYASAVDSGIS